MTADATDADDPDTDNAALRYSILEQGTATMFSINATTGEICTAQPGLDREVAGTRGHGQHRDRVGDHQLRDLWAPRGAGGSQHHPPSFPVDCGGVQPDGAGSRHVWGWAHHHRHGRHLPGGHQ